MMQEKRNKRLFILLIVLLGATGFLFWFNQMESTFTIDKKLFQTVDLETVDQVTLESTAEKIDLKLDGSRWKINGEHEADRNLIDVLFATLQQAESKRPIASSLQDSVSKAVEKNGVKVTLFTKGKKVDSFYAGGNDQKTQGYFHRENELSYLMVIPGYRVYVSGIFELPSNGWRDKFVFGLNWRNLKSMEVSIGQKKTDDFKVLMDESNLGIEGMATPDTTKLYNFLDAVSLLTVDEYLDNNSSLDSLSGTKPVLDLLVKDIADKKYSLKLYPWSNGQFAGLIDEKQWCLLPLARIRPVIRPRSFFNKP